MENVQIFPVPGFPVIRGQVDLADTLVAALSSAPFALQEGDIIVLAHKVVSKAEGRLVDLEDITPGPAAARLAGMCGKDPRLVELVLRESAEVIRAKRPHLIVRTHHGFICANAGIDHSNVGGEGSLVCLLPRDPDASARRLREAVANRLGVETGVLIIDTHGRPFRNGAVGVCLGCSGLSPLRSLVGRKDLFGYVMRTSTEAVADELASAATLVMGQCDEGVPLAVIRGVTRTPGEAPATLLVRDRASDLFARQVRKGESRPNRR